jgi:hypothetical protein
MGFYRSPRNDLNMVRGAACIAQTPERLIIVISVMDKGTKARVRRRGDSTEGPDHSCKHPCYYRERSWGELTVAT